MLRSDGDCMYETIVISKHKSSVPLSRLLIVIPFKFTTICAMFYDRVLWVIVHLSICILSKTIEKFRVDFIDSYWF